MIYSPNTDVYESFRKDLLDMTDLFPDILISHYTAHNANITYNGALYMIAMKFFNIGEKPWYEINAFKPTKISKDYESLRTEYWSKISENSPVDIEYRMHPITINKIRFYSIDSSQHKTLNSIDELKNDVQVWLTEINKKFLKARIEAI